MEIMEGEILRSKITEDLHMVRKIEHGRVILENSNGTVWILLLKQSLGAYYEKIKEG